MSIKNIQTVQTGLVGVLPSLAYIYTSDTEATVLTTGYLNHEVQQGTQFSLPCIAAVSTMATPTSQPQVGWYQVAHVGANWSLVPAGNPGDVVLPTIANHMAIFTNTTGTLGEDAATAINGGKIQSGLSTGTIVGEFIAYPTTASKGFLSLKAAVNATGNFSTTISNALAQAQSTVLTIPDVGAATGNFILSGLVSAGIQHITLGSLNIDAGNLIAGLATGGTAGSLILYPATTTTGSLRLVPVSNVGNFAASISNIVGLGQATVYTLPDPGAATANILVSTSAGGQTIAGGLTVSTGNLAVSAGTITASGVITSTAGSLVSGSAAGGFVGLVKAFPTTASKGFIALQAAVNATGDFGTTITNGLAIAQAQVLTIPDVGAATGFLNPQTVTANLTPGSVLITKDITLGFAALAAGGTVAVQAALATSQYKVRNIFVNYGAAGLSGGGGDRLITLTDGTTVYNDTGITAALLGTPINTLWGGTGNPIAGAVAQNTATVAGQALRFVYSGGAADYAAGSVVVTVTYERVA